MTIEVLRRILELTIYSFVRFLEDLRASRFRSRVVRFHILDKHRKALRSISQVRRACASFFRPFQHDPGISEIHLRATDRPLRLTVPAMLRESKHFAQPPIASATSRYMTCGNTISVGTDRFFSIRR